MDELTRNTAGNKSLAKVADQFSADTFMVNQPFVLFINICVKKRYLRQVRNRWRKTLDTFYLTRKIANLRYYFID